MISAADLDELHIDGAQLLNVTNSAKSAVAVDSDVKFISAAKRTAAVQITGNKLANSIVGGTKNDILSGGYGADTIAGGKGNDKLFGQAGNDYLSGGDGADTLSGGTGNDKLFGDASGDMLTILKSNGAAGGTFTDATFNNKTLTLTIDGGGQITFSNVTKKTNFNINGTSYHVSGKTLAQ